MNNYSGRCTDSLNPALREALGAYVLGALEPAETDQITAHVARCRSCREEYLELLEILPLLAGTLEADVLDGPLKPAPEILDRVLATGRRGAADSARTPAEPSRTPDRDRPPPRSTGRNRPPRRPRRTGFILVAGGVAAVAALAGILTIGLQPATSQTGTQNTWSATAHSAPDPSDTDAGAGAGAETEASVRVTATTWGSSIDLTIQDVPKGYECTMIVVTDDGHREPAGWWKAPSSGTITIPGTAGIDPDQIASVQVRLSDGTTLVTLNRP